MKKSALIITIFMLYSSNIVSQININNTFKTLLILDGCIQDSSDNLENILTSNDLVIETEELISKNTDKINYPIFFDDYFVYSFTVGKNKLETNSKSIFLNSSLCDKYIVVFNIKNSAYYKIKGFKTNDLLFLLRDIINSNNKLKEKNIIRELDGLDLDGLDFKCIYEALTDCPSRFDNYPCLNVCTDGKPSHLSK